MKKTNMKIINAILWASLSLLSFNKTLAQEDYSPRNPAVSSLMNYNEYPVDLSTGLPNIKIPVYSLPTRSKDIGIDLSLRYHPSSVAVYDTISGDAGRGWSLFSVGVISVQQIGNPYRRLVNGDSMTIFARFDYNFFEFSGTFTAKREANGTIIVSFSDKNGAILDADINYGTDNKLSGFTLFDENGYRYVFLSKDEIIDVYSEPQGNGMNPIEYRQTIPVAFKLTKVIDNNNIELLNFEYNSYDKSEEYHQANEKNKILVLKKITSSGYGSLEFSNSIVSPQSYDEKMKYTKVIAKDFLSAMITGFDFLYNGQNLAEFRQSNPLGIKEKAYKFYYKTSIPRMEESDELGYDRWGYTTRYHKFCRTSNTFSGQNIYTTSEAKNASPLPCMTGVLEKMVLPTGGSILYEYESNTYSYYRGIPLENFTYYNDNQLINETDANYFTRFASGNMHNYDKTLYSNKFFENASNVLNFSVTGAKKLYFMFYSTGHQTDSPIIIGENEPPESSYLVYPTFALSKSGQTIEAFEYNPQTLPHDYRRERYSNLMNNNNGKSLDLLSGNYTVTISNGLNPATGSVAVSDIKLSQNIKKWEYGRGMRIKRIGYFNEEGIPQNYYSTTSTSYTPIKEINYDYSLFNDSSRSSGSSNEKWTKISKDTLTGAISYEDLGQVMLRAPYFQDIVQRERNPVRYSNVTAYEKGNNGKTTTSMFSPLDFIGQTEMNLSKIYYGKPKEVKIFSATGALLKSINYSYEITGLHPQNLEYLEPTKIVTKTFSGGSEIVEEKNLSYNYLNRKVRTVELIKNSLEILSTKYYYHTGNSPTSRNRISSVERVESYKNQELLETRRITYGNSWQPFGFDTSNQSYLPHTTSVSKENQLEETISRVNQYDSVSNPLEIQQGNGTKTCYVWGYNSTLPIAKIDNISYSALPLNLIEDAKTASNSGTEIGLLNALGLIRNHASLSTAMITTYTHKPLVGISTVTDPKGNRTTYEYDSFGRLKQAKDRDGNVLSENQYHYRTQN